LIQFSHYFYDKGKDLIALVSKKDNRLYLRDRNAYKNEIDFPTLKYFDIENFLETCQSKWFYVYNAKMGDVFLSNVEMVCIRMLTEGKSAKEIAEKLHRSSRTVESHIQNVRNKLGLGKGTSRADLIAEIYRSGFDLHELILKPTHDNIS
jgi:DNA-binding CsgD family transcriptional regulator